MPLKLVKWCLQEASIATIPHGLSIRNRIGSTWPGSRGCTFQGKMNNKCICPCKKIRKGIQKQKKEEIENKLEYCIEQIIILY